MQEHEILPASLLLPLHMISLSPLCLFFVISHTRLPFAASAALESEAEEGGLGAPLRDDPGCIFSRLKCDCSD